MPAQNSIPRPESRDANYCATAAVALINIKGFHHIVVLEIEVKYLRALLNSV